MKLKKKEKPGAVTHPSTDHSQCCLTFLIKRENTRRRANRANAPIIDAGKKLWFINVAFVVLEIEIHQILEAK